MDRREQILREDLTNRIRGYWSGQIHDAKMSRHPPGSKEFFEDLAEYRYEKNSYLPRLVDFNGYSGKRLLELGCGVGIDLANFAKGGAQVTGIDLSETAINLARQNFRNHDLEGDLRVMDGENLDFPEAAFDVVFAHGLFPYVADPQRLTDEAYRVLKPGGEFIAQVYNRKGWLKYMSKLFKVDLEHQDAPAYRMHTKKEFLSMLAAFSKVRITPERFPVKSRLHKGLKGVLYNTVFVGAFKIIPKPLVRKWGFHLMASAIK